MNTEKMCTQQLTSLLPVTQQCLAHADHSTSKTHLGNEGLCLTYLKIFGGLIPQHDMKTCEGLWRELFSSKMSCVGVKTVTPNNC